MELEAALQIVLDAEKLINEIGFQLGAGSEYLGYPDGKRRMIALIIAKTNGSVIDAAREIIKIGYINHEKAFGKWIYV